MRQFIRHPIAVPIQISLDAALPPDPYRALDISAGGLALRSGCALPVGQPVSIRIRCVQPAFEATGRVAWCRAHPLSGYEVGVSFQDAEDAFRARMVEQICHIEDYRCAVQRLEGRRLELDEAALEWIARYADDFPQIGPEHAH